MGISVQYPLTVPFLGFELVLQKKLMRKYQQVLQKNGLWVDDCHARLIYINGRYVPSLSKSTQYMNNIHSLKSMNSTIMQYMKRFPDGFTDSLVTPVSVTNEHT